MSDPLLKYAISASQDPIQASPKQGTASSLTLIIVVSNSTHNLIDCQSISFGFLKGTDAKDFFADTTGIGSSAPKGWSIKQEGSLFTATPDPSKDGHNGKIGHDSLTFVLSNIKVNQEPGTTPLTVTEVTHNHTGTRDYDLDKFPPHFEVSALQATPPPPIAPGSSVTLTWSGSGGGATYELRYEDADGNTVTITHVKGEPTQPLPASGSYTIDNLQHDTTFYLIVTLPVPGQDKPLTIEKSFPVTVTHLPPKINLFEGKVKFISSKWQLILNWETTPNTGSCSITGDPHPVNPSSTDDSYKIALAPYSSSSKTYQLTARNSVGSDTAQITVDCRFQLIDSIDLGWKEDQKRVRVSSDGARIYVLTAYHVTVLSAKTLKPIGSTGNLGPVYYSDMAVSPDGKHIYLVGQPPNDENDILSKLDAQTLQPIGTPVTIGPWDSAVAVSVDGTLLYMACYGSQHLPVFDSETLKLISNPTITGFPENFIAASPDGARLYIAGQNNSSVVFDAKRLQQLGAPLPIPMHRASVSPDSKRVYMSTGDGTVLCLDSETLKPVDSHWRADGFPYLAVSPDDERLYAATHRGTLYTLDANSLQPIGNPVSPDKTKVFWDITVSPINPHIYVLGEDKLYVFSIVNVSGGRAPASLPDEETAPHRATTLSGEEH